MKRILSLALVIVMVLSLTVVFTGCFKKEAPKCNHVDANGDYACDSCGGSMHYTYNTYMSVFPTVWNNHTYQTATDSEIIGYCELGFYTFDYNEDKTGFTVVPEMAAEMPIDVTADYVGQWDIEEGQNSRVWKIVLRDDLCWENGDPITAHDFVTSAQLLLDPKANNYRADSLYKGELEIINAKNYFYGGKNVYFAASDVYDVYSADIDSQLVFTLGAPSDATNGSEVALRTMMGFPSSYNAQACANYLIANYLEGSNFTLEAATAMEGKTLAEIKADGALNAAWVDLLGWWQTEPNEELHFFIAQDAFPVSEFDTVGIKALSDTELVIALVSPLKGFYLNYNLTGSWLVHEETYRANISWTEGENGEMVYNNTYGTTADSYMSYGPYKLTTFIRDKQIVLTRNEKWYGYAEESEVPTYMTTKIVYDYIDDPETAMNAFLKGELDSKGLDVDQIKDYANSKHTYYTDGASTFFVAMNPDVEAFDKWEADNPGKDKHILSIKEFRMALSFSLNRKEFNLACDPTGNNAFAVFNNMICSDPENGVMYRTTEYAKDVLLEFWGINPDDIGEGKLYADKDEAIDSVTGYNLDAARQLFNQAYDKAIAEGLMSATDVVEICIGLPSATAKFYTNGYTFLTNCWTKAVEGTKLEGKLTFTKDDTIGNKFSDALEINQVNLLFGVGWQGAQLNPFGLIEAYTTPQYQYDVSAWDTSTDTMDFEIEGVTYRASVLVWTEIINGVKREIGALDADGNLTTDTINYSCGLNDNAPEDRLRLLAALEGAVLRTYDLLPLNNESSAALKGMQIKYYTEEYVYGVGRGGIKYMTYNYCDCDWDAFVASQGGTLNYR